MKNEIRTNEVLKRENYKERKPDLGLADAPKEKLTKFEREYLTSVVLKKVAFHYEQTATKMGLLNDHEKKSHGSNILQSDAYNHGVLAFYRCLDKFDKSKYNGNIVGESESVFGSDKPKSLVYFFLVWAKKIITENLLDDLKVIRGRKVYSTVDQKTDESSEEFVPQSPEKQQNSFDLFTKLLNGFGGESVASKILAKEIGGDQELLWYIFSSKIEEVRGKKILQEIMEKDQTIDPEILIKAKLTSELTEEEKAAFELCKTKAKSKLRGYETKTAKIFAKIRNVTDHTV